MQKCASDLLESLFDIRYSYTTNCVNIVESLHPPPPPQEKPPNSFDNRCFDIDVPYRVVYELINNLLHNIRESIQHIGTLSITNLTSHYRKSHIVCAALK